MKKNRMISLLVLLSLVVSCKDKPMDDTYFRSTYDECTMNNESGVTVKVEIIENSNYVQFPTSLTLSPGMKYTWVVPDYEKTKTSPPYPFYPPFGEERPESATIYFADSKPVEYSGSRYNERDPREIDSYVYQESDKTNEKELWSIYVYTFTIEDYQNALKQNEY